MKKYLLLVGLSILFFSSVQAKTPTSYIQDAAERSVIILQKDSTNGNWKSFSNGVLVAPYLIITAGHSVKTGRVTYWVGKNDIPQKVEEKNIIRLNLSRQDSLDIAFIKIKKSSIRKKAIIGNPVELSDMCFLFTANVEIRNIYLESYVAVISSPYELFFLRMPTFFGMSGSGVYNGRGQLVGIVIGGYTADLLHFTAVVPIQFFQKELNKVLLQK